MGIEYKMIYPSIFFVEQNLFQIGCWGHCFFSYPTTFSLHPPKVIFSFLVFRFVKKTYFFVRHWPNLVTWMHRRLKHIGGSDLRFWLRSLTHYCATNTSQHFSSYTRHCDEVTSRTRLGEYTRGGLAHISGTWSQFVIRGRLAQRELECSGSQRFQPQNDQVLWTRHHHYTMWSISIRTHNHYG